MPAATRVGRVVVHNRNDAYHILLGSFEVWVSDGFGRTVGWPSAVRCGGVAASDLNQPPLPVAGPYYVTCGGRVAEFVTVRQVGPPSYLAPAEVSVYAH